jgi:hypothetical protein
MRDAVHAYAYAMPNVTPTASTAENTAAFLVSPWNGRETWVHGSDHESFDGQWWCLLGSGSMRTCHNGAIISADFSRSCTSP